MSLPVIWHPAYEVDIGSHVFITRKYRLAKERLVEEGTIREADLVRPEPASDEDIRLVHTEEYVEKVRAGTLAWHERMALEVPFSPELREAMWLCTGGTIRAARMVLRGATAGRGSEGGGVPGRREGRHETEVARSRGAPGIALHLGGGFHHAFPDHGEGFCLVNDVAVAARRAGRDGLARRTLIVDLDVHHGNGTAAIFAGDPDVFTFSMHQEWNYPVRKPPSDLDVGLEDRTGDDHYLALLEHHLPRILDDHRPDLAFYLAGADPYREDQLGGLWLSLEGLRRRDERVLGTLADAGVPAVVLLAGGYAWKLDDTVEIHCNTVRAAAALVGDGPAGPDDEAPA